nr:hypothetical protein [uncultured bacterium]
MASPMRPLYTAPMPALSIKDLRRGLLVFSAISDGTQS